MRRRAAPRRSRGPWRAASPPNLGYTGAFAGGMPAFRRYGWLCDHFTGREAVPRPRGRTAGGGPPSDRGGKDLPAGGADARRRREVRARAEGLPGDREGGRLTARDESPDRQVEAQDGLPAPHGLPREALADRDPVDRRG